MKIKCRIILYAVISILLAVSVCAVSEDGMMLSPMDKVTVAEAVTMAAKANAAYSGKDIPEVSGENRYDMYVEYALTEGIVSENLLDSLTRPVKRYEAAELFAKALPASYYTSVNNVTDIPDIPDSREYKDEILTLYNAGVIIGTDSYGNFQPEDSITRAEISTIMNRVVFPEQRLKKSFDVYSKDDSFYLNINSSMNNTMTGIQSGWVLDNRGGIPRTDIMTDYTVTNDISKTAGTALIREFNKTSTGNIVLDSEISVVNSDGFYIEYRNEDGDSVYKAEIVDGAWCVLENNGRYSPVYTVGAGESLFKLVVETDLDNYRSTTYINDVFCGTRSLLTDKEDTNFLNFRFATTEESLASYSPVTVSIASNYTLDESFARTEKGIVPKNWTAYGGTVAAGEIPYGHLDVPGEAGAAYTFPQINGMPVAEFHILLPENESVEYTLKSGNKVVAEFKTDDNAFYVNKETVYEDYYKNLWYRIRFEVDTDTQTILVKVNGRNRGSVPFAEAATSVNNFTLKNNSATTVQFDNFKLFRLVEHDDYVPVPVVPEGADDYTVGMNVCSLWKNGSHFGWATITPYDDPQPVLGYYDECNPETADWEIKYLVEHGIDFQAFCMFFYHDGPFNIGAGHLFDGFMNAKYSDMSKFCILLEAANGDSPRTVEDWKERWVPYIIENFIKHESYAVVDNRPVFSVFGTGDLYSKLGSYESVKECFDYLEEEVIKLGFDGMIYLGCGSSTEAMQAMGFDGCHAYNWGYAGYDAAQNMNNITSSSENSYVYTVPTVSVGFNHVPWNGSRFPLMTMDDYRTVHEWVRDEYLPTAATESWQEKLVWLSTWNEYGEGTYIMPTTDEKGFGYIDVVREVYTREDADPLVNRVPTNAQKYRINHLYPQYRRLLRAEGNYSEIPDENESEVLFKINMADLANKSLWSMKDIVRDENGITAKGTNNDPIFSISEFSEEFYTDDVTHIKLTAKIPPSKLFQIYYATGKNSGSSESRVVSGVSTIDDMAEYYFSTDSMKTWGGKLNYIRIDPVSQKDLEFTVKSVEFIRDNGKLPKTMIVDDRQFDITITPLMSETGEIFIAFDPKSAIDFRLNLFHEWNKEKGVLKLSSEDCEIVYTVGSNKYKLNGETQELGYNLGTLDGLPLISVRKLCEDLGYKYSVNEDNIMVVETNLKEYYDSISDTSVPGKWEFNVTGDTEKWSSDIMRLLVNNGYMACNSKTDVLEYTDPRIVSREFESFSADDMGALEMRIRYDFKPVNANYKIIKMYFMTDVNNVLSEENCISVPLETTDTGGKWVTIRMPLPENFTGNVTYLRFDPFDGVGCVDIDYIRFLTKEEL